MPYKPSTHNDVQGHANSHGPFLTHQTLQTMKACLLCFFLLTCIVLFAQKMTPAQEAYRQKLLKQYSAKANALSAGYNLKIDESRLPGFDVQPPPKDLARLASLPKQPPTLVQLADGLRASKKQLEAAMPKAVVESVSKTVASQTQAQNQSTAVGLLRNDQPAQSLLVAMNAALQDVQNPLAWNNLAAVFNMTGLEHKAIPILMQQLQQDPTNATLLNNTGQAYLGLGDVVQAENFLTQCLAQDPLHPEANRSMGLIKFFQKQFDEGAKYFEKELAVAYRRSTVALLKKHGRPANLYNIRKRSGKVPGKNYMEEVKLDKFKLPALPMTCDDEPRATIEAQGPLASMTAEMLFWNGVLTETDQAQVAAEGKRPPGVYSELVDELLHGLHDAFPPENLTLLAPDDIDKLQNMMDAYYARVATIKCPPVPDNATVLEAKAFAKKCCEETTPIADAFMAAYNGLIKAKLNTVQGRWKQYLNDLINIASLDPSYANRKMVYAEVQAYFVFLVNAWNSVRFEHKPVVGCDPAMSDAEADSLMASARNVDLRCPPWLNFEIDLQGAKFKADCSKFEIEVGSGIVTNFEKNFKTGTVTLAAGFSKSAEKFDAGKGSVKQYVYFAFDNDWQCVDAGLKGKAEFGINTGAIPLLDGAGKGSAWLDGIEAGYTLSIESGWNSYVKGKGVLTDVFKAEFPK